VLFFYNQAKIKNSGKKYTEMKRIVINEYQLGLVMKNGAYKRMLAPGIHWVWNAAVKVYEVTQMFVPPVDLNILLQDAHMAARLEVIEVQDNEVVLHFENNMLKQVLFTGRYAFWKSIVPNRFVRANVGQIDVDVEIEKSLLSHRLMAPYIRSYTVESYEKGLLMVDGKFVKVLDSGVYYWWKNAIPVQVGKVDTRQLQLEINGQEMLTKDKAALRINAWAQYRIVNIEQALLENKDYEKQLYVTFQLALREYVTGFSFDELLERKESIAPRVLEAVKGHAEVLGIAVLGFGIRDIILPGDIRDIMNQVLVAEKKAQANVIMRREETASTRSLLNTAKLMEENAMLWKLKEMEYVEKIAEKISTISVNGNGALMEQLKQIFVNK
jgi:regulator of protease activity HflC (stomatin/prohibitin superfamily)